MRSSRVTRRMVVGGLKGKPKMINRWWFVFLFIIVSIIGAILTK